MSLIQPRQVQGLFEDLTELKADVLSGSNENYDLLHSDQTLTGKKTWVSDATFEQKVQINTTGMGYDFSLSGEAFIGLGYKFTYGNPALYTYAQPWNKLTINNTADGASGLINLVSNSGIIFDSPNLDLSVLAPNLLLSQSSKALEVTVGGTVALTFDTTTPSSLMLGLNNITPTVALDITGTQKMDGNNESTDVLTLANSGGAQTNLVFNSITGSSSLGVYDDTSALNGFYLQATDNLPLYLGHASKQAIRIDYTGMGPRVRIGDDYFIADRPLEAAASVLEIHNTGYTDGPIVTLYNDKATAGSHCALRFVENNFGETASWALGHFDEAILGNSSFRLAYSGGANASLGTNEYLTIDQSGTMTLRGTGIATNGAGGGNLKVSGNIHLTSGLFFNYDEMPNGDPAIQGLVWRDELDTMGGGVDSLFISAG